MVWLAHRYTSGYIDTAAACVNAGVSLEDGNFYNVLNTFDHIGEAVAAVSYYCSSMWLSHDSHMATVPMRDSLPTCSMLYHSREWLKYLSVDAA